MEEVQADLRNAWKPRGVDDVGQAAVAVGNPGADAPDGPIEVSARSVGLNSPWRLQPMATVTGRGIRAKLLALVAAGIVTLGAAACGPKADDKTADGKG